MAHSSKIFDAQPIRVQNVNGFDLSHINAGTALCGTLTPVLCKLVMQGTKFSLGCAVNVELPPLAAPFFGRIDAHIECFFVPCSICYAGWTRFISGQAVTMFPSSQVDVVDDGGYALPRFAIPALFGDSTFQAALTANKSLTDYLGIRPISFTGSAFGYCNLLPFIAYARIWDVFYRNASLTRTIFAVNPNLDYGYGPDTSVAKNISYVWHSFYTNTVLENPGSGFISSAASFDYLNDELRWPDGKQFYEMRQRCYPRDYFTSASLNPQQGNPSKLGMNVNFTRDSQGEITAGDVEFTIAALRASNSLQKFYEAMNYDPSYRGIMRAQFGSSPKDAELDEPVYLGRVVLPVYQHSVYQSKEGSDDTGAYANPFTSNGDLGARGASGTFKGEGQICRKFTAGCFGYVFGIFSLVPHAMYSYGIDRQNTMLEIGDFPFPLLQSVGMDSIKTRELYVTANTSSSDWDTDFGYIPRYSFMKYIDDSVHGELRPGKSLDSFALQRVFASTPVLSTSFVEIPTNALDGIFGTNADISNFSCWYEIYWVFKAVMPLAEFCVPTLGELQDTHEISVSQGGSRL